MSRKALFFDIDGTLFSEISKQVPQSAALALRKTRQNGNLVFINTGRTLCQTEDIRREVEADGLLCGCGTYITAGKRVLYDHRISGEQAERIKDSILRFGMDGVLEGVEGCYFRAGGPVMPVMRQIWGFLKANGSCAAVEWDDPSCRISKFCVTADENSDREGFFASLEGIDVIDRGGGFYECVPQGHSKASAIERILKQYAVPRENAWVFGDSMNDLSMFQYSMNSVLMGKHDKGLEPYATFVTKTVEEDGIAYAMEKLGMLRAEAV